MTVRSGKIIAGAEYTTRTVDLEPPNLVFCTECGLTSTLGNKCRCSLEKASARVTFESDALVKYLSGRGDELLAYQPDEDPEGTLTWQSVTIEPNGSKILYQLTLPLGYYPVARDSVLVHKVKA